MNKSTMTGMVVITFATVLNGGQMTTDADNNAFIYGTPEDPYTLTTKTDVKGDYAYNGYTGTEGALVVAGATLTVSNEMRFGSSDNSRTPTKSTTVITNGGIKAQYLVFSGNGTNDKSNKDVQLNTLTLDKNGSMQGQLVIYDDPKTKIIFNGGWFVPQSVNQYKHAADLYNGLNSVFACAYNNSVNEIYATEGNLIDIASWPDLALANTRNGMGGVQFRFTGPGGFQKNGAGLLLVGNPAAFTMDYAGDTILKQGTVRMCGDDIFPSGSGKGRLLLTGATLDLNGKKFTANAVSYHSGAITNTASTPAELVVGADGSDSDFTVNLPDGVTLVKRGSGTLSLKALAPKNVRIEEGAIQVAEPVSYRHYRFKITRPYGNSADCTIISEFKLLDFGTDVTRPYATVSRSGTGKDGAGWSWKGVSEGPECAVDGNLNTKFTDHNGATDSSGSDLLRDQCWLQIDYAEPIRVSAYNWATGGDKYSITDSGCRNPKNWQLLGSNDGENWTVIDSRSDYAWAGATAKSWNPDIFLTGNGSLAESSVFVSPGARLVSPEGAEARVNGGAILGDQNADSTLVKTGDGVLNLRAQAPGKVVVEGGTLAAGAVKFAHYRFKVTRAKGSSAQCLNYSEFKLINAAGEDVTQGFVKVSRSGTGPDGAGFSWKGKSEGPECAVDGNLETKFTDHNVTGDVLRATCWLQLDYAAPVEVASYNWASVKDSDPKFWTPSNAQCRSPADWQLLGSEDGTNNWVVLDTIVDWSQPNAASMTWNSSPFAMTAGSVADSTLAVKEGATLDLSGCNTPVSLLEVDVSALASGVGTIRGGSFAQTGTISLVNANGTKFGRDFNLRLAFVDSTATTQTFKDWTITVDGIPTTRKLSVAGGVLYLSANGLSLLIK